MYTYRNSYTYLCVQMCEWQSLHPILSLVQGLYMVELQLIQYQNPDHVLKNGSCCDNPGTANCSDPCDNYFLFWEGNTTTSESPVYETEVYQQVGDFIHFFNGTPIPLVGRTSTVSNVLNFTADPRNWQVRNDGHE